MSPDDVSPRGAWAMIRGTRMHYRFSRPTSDPFPFTSSSPSYPIVLVHGLSVSSGYMVPTMRALGRSARVYAPDLPGFGKSEKPRRALDISELAEYAHDWMRAIGVERAHVLGHSLGAQIVVDLATRWPSQVASLVLAGPTTDPRAPTVPLQAMRLLRDMTREPPAFWPVVLGEYLEAGPRRTIRTIQAGIRDPFLDKVRRLGVPVLVVRGERDPIAPQEWTDEVASTALDARSVTIARGAHAIPFHTPEQLATLIQCFTRDVSARIAGGDTECPVDMKRR